MTDTENVEPSEGHRAPRARRSRAGLGWALAAVTLPLALFLTLPSSPETLYGFFKADHAIDEDSDGAGRWFYFMPDVSGKTPAQLADAARAELVPRGYTEDTSNRPWFRFVKGGREVIVCNHDEIADGDPSPIGIRVMHGRPLPAAQRGRWPVVWVREPGTNTAGVVRFKIQKLVFRW